MKAYKTVLFDLDGTVVETAEGMFSTVRYTADRLGLELPAGEDLSYFIGPPLQDSFAKRFALDSEAAARAVKTYRERYRSKGIFEHKPYNGICDLIKGLYETGRTVYLATSKPTEFAEQIIGYIGLKSYFRDIVGSYFSGERSSKKDIIGYILESDSFLQKESTIMVGDTHFDVIGANRMGIDSVAVMYGDGKEELVREAGPSYMVETVAELRELLLK